MYVLSRSGTISSCEVNTQNGLIANCVSSLQETPPAGAKSKLHGMSIAVFQK